MTHCEHCKKPTEKWDLTTVFDERVMETMNVCEKCQLTVKYLVKYPVSGLHFNDNS